ncbi:hypothetical protein ACFQX7_11145 [Luedemannella flava]
MTRRPSSAATAIVSSTRVTTHTCGRKPNATVTISVRTCHTALASIGPRYAASSANGTSTLSAPDASAHRRSFSAAEPVATRALSAARSTSTVSPNLGRVCPSAAPVSSTASISSPYSSRWFSGYHASRRR